MSTETAIRTARGQSVIAYLNPAAMARNLWRHRGLTLQLARRDIVGRYRNSWLGLLWSVITPLVMLVIYTFVFAVVFKSKWGDTGQESNGMFALTMFCGMLLFNLFAEVVNRSPTMVADNANYVKKVVFPLETLVVSALLAALFTLTVGFGAWAAGWCIINRTPPSPTVLWLPVVLVPVLLTTAGLSWLLASVGVFVRDLGHAVVIATQVLFFTTPIFYRIERVPDRFQFVMKLNPLSHAVEEARRVMMAGKYAETLGDTTMTFHPDWGQWAIYTGASALIALLGYAFFMKSKRAFSDVI